MVTPEHVHTTNIVQTEQIIIRNICIHTHTYICLQAKILNDERGHELKETKEEYIGVFGGR